jgi:hypothetical protein
MVVFAHMFTDHDYRYIRFPYEDPDGFFVRIGDGRRAAVHAHAAYLAVPRPSSEPAMYGVCIKADLSMPSGYTLSADYIFAEEDISSPGYYQYHYLRLGVGHLLFEDSNALVRLGFGMVVFDAETGDDPYEYKEYEDAVGLGVEFSIHHFVQKPLVLMFSAAPAAAENGTITDLEAGIGIFTGPVQFTAGYRSLIFPEDDISGPFVSVGYWF